MRIGIDAKWFFEGPVSAKNVLRQLIAHLLKEDSQNQYYLILDKNQKKEFFPYQAPNLHLIYTWAGNNQLSNLFFIPYLARKFQLEVVLFQNFSAIWGKFFKVAYVHDAIFLSHPQYYTWKEKLYFWPMRYLARFANKVITITEEEKKRLWKYKFTSKQENIVVIYHGIESLFKPLSEWDSLQAEKVKQKFKLPDQFLLYVGRLNIRKNIQNLIKALAFMQDKEIPLLIVGKKEWKMFDIDKLLLELKLKDRVKFAENVSNEELAVIYAQARVFCFPSFEEGFGLPPLEAMASGIPVVVSNRSSMPEICREAGNYTDPENPAQIALVIDELLNNIKLYEEKKEIGLKRAKMFDWNKAAKEIIYHLTSFSNNK